MEGCDCISEPINAVRGNPRVCTLDDITFLVELDIAVCVDEVFCLVPTLVQNVERNVLGLHGDAVRNFIVV